MFTEIPTERPNTPLLDQVNNPEQLRRLSVDQLDTLATELRSYLLYSVGQSGGHFGAGLGVVELTIALHYVLNTPSDRLIWDVGHQAYPHKVLTERREQLPSIRSQGGLAAFPCREESRFDCFGVGHSSTSISSALGMSEALKHTPGRQQVVAVIGDGAMTAGMAFEALNHAGHEDADMLIVFNDNDMSISENVGALSKYFGRLISSKPYAFMREGSKKVLSNLPKAWEFARRTEEHVKGMVTPGTLFEEMGFNYVGPVDGHNVNGLVRTLETLSSQTGPRFLHLITQKGKGFKPAEQDPIKYHALSPRKPSSYKPSTCGPSLGAAKKPITYSNIFGQWLCDMAAQDKRLIGITPAMREGSDMVAFSERFPDRYYDVAIAEQHAVTFAAGLACEGKKPVVAIYSTFLQRAYDQLIHDVAIQNLDVTFAIDRAGLVGADGPTHAGAFDLSFLRCIPNLLIMAPGDEAEARNMLYTAYQHQGPAAVRYPRGSGLGVEPSKEMSLIPLGQARRLRESNAKKGQRLAVLNFGHCLPIAKQVVESIDASLIDMRFIKPLDTEQIRWAVQQHNALVCIEDNAVKGGAGSAVLEFLAEQDLHINTRLCGLPDAFVEHGSQQEQYQSIGLDAESLIKKCSDLLGI
jgi:1-deoxy-D-xylulose-5-phosphate synthase